jgi:hypothetical protein
MPGNVSGDAANLLAPLPGKGRLEAKLKSIVIFDARSGQALWAEGRATRVGLPYAERLA